MIDYKILKDNLDFYEKIINVTRINDGIVHELTGAMVSLHALTTFNMCETKFDGSNNTAVFRINGNEVRIDNRYDSIFRLTYLKYLAELYLKDNKGLRIIQNYLKYTNSDKNDFYNEIYDYVQLRKQYIDDDENNNDYIKHHIYSLQERFSKIRTLLEELR